MYCCIVHLCKLERDKSNCLLLFLGMRIQKGGILEFNPSVEMSALFESVVRKQNLTKSLASVVKSTTALNL